MTQTQEKTATSTLLKAEIEQLDREFTPIKRGTPEEVAAYNQKIDIYRKKRNDFLNVLKLKSIKEDEVLQCKSLIKSQIAILNNQKDYYFRGISNYKALINDIKEALIYQTAILYFYRHKDLLHQDDLLYLELLFNTKHSRYRGHRSYDSVFLNTLDDIYKIFKAD